MFTTHLTYLFKNIIKLIIRLLNESIRVNSNYVGWPQITYLLNKLST